MDIMYLSLSAYLRLYRLTATMQITLLPQPLELYETKPIEHQRASVSIAELELKQNILNCYIGPT